MTPPDLFRRIPGVALCASSCRTPAIGRSKLAATTIFSRLTALEFDRPAAYGMRLNIAAGTAVRFEPGEGKQIELTHRGRRIVHGFHGLVDGALGCFTGPANAQSKRRGQARRLRGWRQEKTDESKYSTADLCRSLRSTKGDRIRLADTELIVEIEKDFTCYGDEITFGGGKVIRDGMGQSSLAPREEGRRARPGYHECSYHRSLGHRESRHRDQKRAHREDRQSRESGHHGRSGSRSSGRSRHRSYRRRKLDRDSRGMDSHVHFISPQQIYEAISNGITTMIGGGTGPATGTAPPPAPRARGTWRGCCEQPKRGP